MTASASTSTPAAARRRSKTLATWIALTGGSLGLHRFYLHGWRDVRGWLHVLPALAGLYGVQRMRELGQDDQLAWLLVPLLGLALAAAMLAAIVYGLTTDDAWQARFDPHGPPVRSGWAAIFGVVMALAVGATVLMATIAFAGQRYFEHRADTATRPPAR